MVAALRYPLWTLPEPGRDEALYHLWAHHPELSYAPLLQALVRISEAVFGHTVFALRAPMLALALFVLWLNDRRLVRAAATPTYRLWMAALLAITPWQSYTGSVLHPDNLLLTGLLLFVLCCWDGRVLGAALCGVFLVAAKPTGVILLPVVWWMVGRLDGTRSRTNSARALVAAALCFFVFSVDLPMLRGMAQFGLDPAVSPLQRASGGAVALLFLSGPLLLYFAGQGFGERWAQIRSRSTNAHVSSPRMRREFLPMRREAEASLACALVLIAFFFVAALGRGQFKANWWLPALVLLTPLMGALPRRPILAVGIAFSLLTSAGQTWVLADPDRVHVLSPLRLAEQLAPGLRAFAGPLGDSEEGDESARREETAERLVTDPWRRHLAQYRGRSGWAREVARDWSVRRGSTPPDWIATDHYGLAAQLRWHCRWDDTRLAVWGDDVFAKTRTRFGEDSEARVLWLPVGQSVDNLVENLSEREDSTERRSSHPRPRFDRFVVTYR